jgi:hypothetical protein
MTLALTTTLLLTAGCRTGSGAPRHPLHADRAWQLNLPNGERFDSSALLQLPGGELITLNDRGADLFRIQLGDGLDAELIPWKEPFAPRHLEPFAKEKLGRYDCEGIARDDQGRLYLCEEANRWILRWDPKADAVQRLPIDWSPVSRYFHRTDRNASFEGIAVGGNRLFVANERQRGRIIVVDLGNRQVIDSFAPQPSSGWGFDRHYSDLAWYGGRLYVLLRDKRSILEVDPATRRVVAEFPYGAVERAREYAYHSPYPTGAMEGLAVDAGYFWLLTDNNGCGRKMHPKDLRPTLFRCPRPQGP